jgi:hypothetical protein
MIIISGTWLPTCLNQPIILNGILEKKHKELLRKITEVLKYLVHGTSKEMDVPNSVCPV